MVNFKDLDWIVPVFKFTKKVSKPLEIELMGGQALRSMTLMPQKTKPLELAGPTKVNQPAKQVSTPKSHHETEMEIQEMQNKLEI